MTTKPFAMVRGSSLRVTALDKRGRITSPVRYATSRSVATVTVTESSDEGRTELIRDSNDRPSVFVQQQATQTLFTVDIRFLRVDPGLLALLADVRLLRDINGDVVGVENQSKATPKAFALEVWSRLPASACTPGQREYGYTLFPFLRGGVIDGFEFGNSLVSFNLRNAQTAGSAKWGVGAHDLTAPYERLLEPVSGNARWRSLVTTAAPPAEQAGVVEFDDIISGGTAASAGADILSGGTAAATSPWIVSGGQA